MCDCRFCNLNNQGRDDWYQWRWDTNSKEILERSPFVHSWETVTPVFPGKHWETPEMATEQCDMQGSWLWKILSTREQIPTMF